MLVFYIVILWLAYMWLCFWLAGEKKRSVLAWLFLALLLGLLATVVLGLAPSVETEK